MKYPFPAVVLFDWDNTLLDTTPVLYRAFCEMRNHDDLPDCSMDEYRALPARNFPRPVRRRVGGGETGLSGRLSGASSGNADPV